MTDKGVGGLITFIFFPFLYDDSRGQPALPAYENVDNINGEVTDAFQNLPNTLPPYFPPSLLPLVILFFILTSVLCLISITQAFHCMHEESSFELMIKRLRKRKLRERKCITIQSNSARREASSTILGSRGTNEHDEHKEANESNEMREVGRCHACNSVMDKDACTYSALNKRLEPNPNPNFNPHSHHHPPHPLHMNITHLSKKCTITSRPYIKKHLSCDIKDEVKGGDIEGDIECDIECGGDDKEDEGWSYDEMNKASITSIANNAIIGCDNEGNDNSNNTSKKKFVCFSSQQSIKA